MTLELALLIHLGIVWSAWVVAYILSETAKSKVGENAIITAVVITFPPLALVLIYGLLRDRKKKRDELAKEEVK